MRTIQNIPVISLNQADARIARVHAAVPCMAKDAWLHASFLGGYTGLKPEPRRLPLTS